MLGNRAGFLKSIRSHCGEHVAPRPQFQRRNRITSFSRPKDAVFSAKLLAVAPDLLLFFKHAGGQMVSAALLGAAMAASDAHAAVPFADVGERFGLSRTHVRSILIEAQDAGLVRLDGRGGRRVEILPRLWMSYDRGLATGMFSHDMVHALATGRSARKADDVATGAVSVLTGPPG